MNIPNFDELNRLNQSKALVGQLLSKQLEVFTRSNLNVERILPSNASAINSAIKRLIEQDNLIMPQLVEKMKDTNFTRIFEQNNLAISQTLKIFEKAKVDFGLDIIAKSIEQNPSFLSQISQNNSLTSMISQLEKAGSLFKAIAIGDAANFSAILSVQKIQSKIFSQIENISILDSLSKLSSSYSALATSWEPLIDEENLQNTEIIAEKPALEFLNHTNVIEKLLVTEDNQDEIAQDKSSLRQELYPLENSIEQTLSSIEARDLIEMWNGASFALCSKHPDYARHLSISLRELITQILHRLAPDEKVKEWSNDPNLYHNNKPTRKARLLYICRGINHGKEFQNFVEQDIKEVITLINIFHTGAHKATISYTFEQLDAFRLRTGDAINFLINIDKRNE